MMVGREVGLRLLFLFLLQSLVRHAFLFVSFPQRSTDLTLAGPWRDLVHCAQLWQTCGSYYIEVTTVVRLPTPG